MEDHKSSAVSRSIVEKNLISLISPMASSPVDRMSGASTPTLLAMSSFATNRLHEELSGLKRWRQMYDSAMNEKVCIKSFSINLIKIHCRMKNYKNFS